VSGRIGQCAKVLQRCLPVLDAEPTRGNEMIRHIISQDLQGPLNPRPRGDRSACRTAEVGIVEVGESIRCCAHLPAHPALLPGKDRLVGPQTGQECPDRIAITDHDTIDTAHFT
jgi:hypothetical protein